MTSVARRREAAPGPSIEKAKAPAMTLVDRLRDGFRDWRNRVIADARFQDFAATFPLTRPLARRRATELFDICAGFVYSQTLSAAVELELFDMLRDGPLPLREIARRANLPEDGAERLLKAGASLRLFEARAGGAFALGELGAALLGNAGVFPMILHHKALYADLADPVALFRARSTETALARYWRYASGVGRESLSPEDAARYSALMAATQGYVTEEILHALRFEGCRRFMDVGGGSGAFLAAAARRAPHVALMLFDLPAVADLAAARFAAEGLAGRIDAIGGDFHRDPLPEGADVISFIRILHDHDDGAVRTLLRKAHAALPAGGRLLIVEPMAGAAGAAAMGDAYFGVYLWAMGSGRPRTRAELTAMLQEAGFGRVRSLPSRRPVLTEMLIAER